MTGRMAWGKSFVERRYNWAASGFDVGRCATAAVHGGAVTPPPPKRCATDDYRHRSSRSALPITIRSDAPMAAAQKIGLMKPSAASGTPSAL